MEVEHTYMIDGHLAYIRNRQRYIINRVNTMERVNRSDNDADIETATEWHTRIVGSSIDYGYH